MASGPGPCGDKLILVHRDVHAVGYLMIEMRRISWDIQTGTAVSYLIRSIAKLADTSDRGTALISFL